MNQATVGARIKLARQQTGLTQTELAKKVGTSQATIHNWEAGKATPDTTQEKKLEGILGTGLFGTEEPSGDIEGVSIVGAWLSKARQKASLTQQELATKSGVTQVTISHIETGRARNPQRRTIQLLGEALGEPFEKEAERELEKASEIEGLGRFTDFDPHDERGWPTEPGIYVFYDISERPIYVGQARNIARRIKEHRELFWFRPPIVKSAAYVQIQEDTLRVQIETILIKFLKSNAVINKQQVERN